MKKTILFASAVAVLLAFGQETLRPHRIFAFGSLYGVDDSLLGKAGSFNGLPGDELPWAVRSGRGVLWSDGELRVSVKGLVFADDPLVPPDLVGTNDETEFRVVLSCFTKDAKGALVNAQLTTEGFPATKSGDCSIHTVLELPQPCLMPALFIIAGSEDKWFAVNGFEDEKN